MRKQDGDEVAGRQEEKGIQMLGREKALRQVVEVCYLEIQGNVSDSENLLLLLWSQSCC